MPDRKATAAENEELRRQLAQMARALNQCEARYDAVFNSDVVMTTICTVEGVVLDVNRTALQSTGLRIEDCVGKYVWDSPWFAAAPGEAARIKAAIQKRSAKIIHYEFSLLTSANQLGVFDVTIRPVRAQTGGEVRFLVLEGRELTGQRAAEERAARSERMEALGLLTGGIAHDFNNFLTVVIGALDIVVRRPDSAKQSALIEAALEAAQKAEALNKQLLAFARRRPLAAEQVDVGAALRSLEPLLKKAVGEAVEVHLHVPGDSPWVRMETAQFEAAVLNLCINARDAMPSGGRIEIEARRPTTDERAAAGVNGPAVLVAVTDNGVGIAPDVLPRVFDPFFTTKGAGGGTGLGLSQVYGFATQTGGGVDLVSAPGGGSTFKMILPCVAGADAEGVELNEARQPLGIRNVLLVEDDESVAGVTRAMLTELGLQVVTAPNGPEAQHALERGQFDLLMTDVIMPGGMNGVQLADWVRARRPAMKVLLFSGWTAGTAVETPDHLSVMQKPFDMAALKRAIQKLA